MTEATPQDAPAPERDWPEFDIADAMNDLSLGEMEEWEDLTGLVFTAIASTGLPAKGITALMFLIFKRTFPDLTMEEIRARPLMSLGSEVEVVEPAEVDPTKPV